MNMEQGLRKSGSRRRFIVQIGAMAAAATVPGCRLLDKGDISERIIDIHQHAGYSGRSDEELLAHQATMGVTRTILLPAGRPMNSESTHQAVSNGLQAQCLGNEACRAISLRHPGRFLFAANEVPDAPGAVGEIEKYLKLGGVAIAEQKFGLECDAPEMQRLYVLAADYNVPILMHWQHEMYNYGFDRFHRMLEKHPRTRFIGHAQTWWANVDQNHTNQKELYPKGPVTPGGWTDVYLRDYPNMYGDLSAGSGLNSLTRDEGRAVEFLTRHQDKLLYGSDCNDRAGWGDACQGAQTIATVRRLVPDLKIRAKIFEGNARRVFRI